MTADVRSAVAALTAVALASEQIEDLGNQLILDLSEDLIGEADQSVMMRT